MPIPMTQTPVLIETSFAGAIAMIVQLVVYFVVAKAVPHFPDAIMSGRVSSASFLAALAVAVGLLNAAAMTS